MLRNSYKVVFFFFIFFGLVEILGRFSMYFSFGSFPVYKEPLAYFNYFSDEKLWALNFKMGKPLADVASLPHALIGWRNMRYDDNFNHINYDKIGKKRPVLLYGDSFGSCTHRVSSTNRVSECFEDYFNADAELNKNCYFLNYSTGAHGLDQIYLVMVNSIDKFKSPLVIMSAMTLDLDRATVGAYTSPKPFFIEGPNNQLILKGTPVPLNPKDYFNNIDLGMSVYLLKYLENKLVNFDPFYISENHKKKTSRISKLILLNQTDFLRKRNVDFTYLIFTPNTKTQSSIWQKDEDDWRQQLIKATLKDLNVSYFGTKEWTQASIKKTNKEMSSYFLENDGHPTELLNKVIYENLKSSWLKKHCS